VGHTFFKQVLETSLQQYHDSVKQLCTTLYELNTDVDLPTFLDSAMEMATEGGLIAAKKSNTIMLSVTQSYNELVQAYQIIQQAVKHHGDADADADADADQEQKER
jgi:hypothetical protein